MRSGCDSRAGQCGVQRGSTRVGWIVENERGSASAQDEDAQTVSAKRAAAETTDEGSRSALVCSHRAGCSPATPASMADPMSRSSARLVTTFQLDVAKCPVSRLLAQVPARRQPLFEALGCHLRLRAAFLNELEAFPTRIAPLSESPRASVHPGNAATCHQRISTDGVLGDSVLSQVGSTWLKLVLCMLVFIHCQY